MTAHLRRCHRRHSIGDASGSSDPGHRQPGDIVGLVFNGCEVQRAIEIVGDLAESWSVGDTGWRSPSHFARVPVAHARPAVPSPVTAELIIRPSLFFRQLRLYSVEVLDERGPRPLPRAVCAALSWMMGSSKHLLERKTQRLLRPVGTRPYRFKRWKTGESWATASLTTEHRPYIDRISTGSSDQATLFLELLTHG